MVVTRLFRLSEQSFWPSKVTPALLRVKKTVSRMIDELNMKGRIEIIRLTFRSEIIAKEAMVMPIAKEPVLPTKIFPETFKSS